MTKHGDLFTVNTLKERVKKLWSKTKAFFVSILVALGLLTALPVGAGDISFGWTNPTLNTDGTVFDPATELAEVRIYCNGATTPTFTSLGALESLSDTVPPGTYTCYATAYDTSGKESGPSNTVTKIVEKAPPNPPILN